MLKKLTFRSKLFSFHIILALILLLILPPLVTSYTPPIVTMLLQTRIQDLVKSIENSSDEETLHKIINDRLALAFLRITIFGPNYRLIGDSHLYDLTVPSEAQVFEEQYPEVVKAYQEPHVEHTVKHKSFVLDRTIVTITHGINIDGGIYVLRITHPEKAPEIVTQMVVFLTTLSIIITAITFSIISWIAVSRLFVPIQEILSSIKAYRMGKVHTLPKIILNHGHPDDDINHLAETLNALNMQVQEQIESLSSKNEETSKILDTLIEGIIAVKSDMTVIYSNQSSKKMLGISPERLKGKYIDKIQNEKLVELVRDCQKEKKIITILLDLNNKNTETSITVRAYAVPQKGGMGTVLVMEDQTLQQKIIQRQKDFVSNASHELKTPLTVIKGFAQTLSENPDLPIDTIQQVTARIASNCERMERLVRTLLTLTDVEHLPPARLAEIPLHILLNQCQEYALSRYSDANIIVDCDRGITVLGDPDLLEIAIVNLLYNACKYSELGKKIHLSAEKENDMVYISCRDEGIGIPDDSIDHIFDRFYRVDEARTREMGGSGLGLSIVKTIIEKHFGTASAKSKLGKGSTFTLAVPEDFSKIKNRRSS